MPVLPHLRRYRSLDNIVQFISSLYGLVRPVQHNVLCNILCEFVFSVVPYNAVEIVLGIVVHNISRRQCLPSVHAHVKRCIVTVGKTSLLRVELIGGNTEIEHDPIHSRHALCRKRCAHIAVIVPQNRHLISEGSKPPARGRDCRVVLIDPIEMTRGKSAAHLPCMSATAQRAVHIDSVRLNMKLFNGLRKQNGIMIKLHEFSIPACTSASLRRLPRSSVPD